MLWLNKSNHSNSLAHHPHQYQMIYKIYYQDIPSKLRKIEALYQQDNALLKTRRKLTMEFTDLYDKNILTSYSIDGTQKMFVGDSIRFTINCAVQLN